MNEGNRQLPLPPGLQATKNNSPQQSRPLDLIVHPPTTNAAGQYQSRPASDASSRTQRRRNKPSLSCEPCTVKKTKCDRGRPACFACIKRRSECHYSHLADLIEESHRALGIDSPRKKPKTPSSTISRLPVPTEYIGPSIDQSTPPTSFIGSPQMLLSNVPFSYATASNVFKMEHPFTNYWTHQGGLAEVVGVLPSKEQADILLAKYFDVVDPVYPMIHQESFRGEYERFWSLQPAERLREDASLVSLIFVMLAMGTQFVALPSTDEKEKTAEFYVSASHQALRVFNYLGRPSLRSIQTMVLIIYFLMNDNHASDAWAFAGILTRQAYALGLNRDPSIMTAHAHPFEKQQRRKVWQAVLVQDTFFSVILKLPPTVTHSDVRVEDLSQEPEASPADACATDILYMSSMWTLANIVQYRICIPRALSNPISKSPGERSQMISYFHRVYMSFPLPFHNCTEASICDLASQSKRLARQTLFITSNYYHCLMLINADEHENLEIDVNGTFESAHEAINSYFLLHKLFEDEAKVWYHFQYRAFSEALVIADLVRNKSGNLAMDPMRLRAKDDVLKMTGILQLGSDHDVVAKTRVSALSHYL